MAAVPAASLISAEDRFIEAVGAAIEFWGFKRILGHTWAWLYLAGSPQEAAAIGKRLGLSKAAVSTALKELESWGCVLRTRRPNSRREFFEAEQDVWEMVSRVFRQRELPRIQKTVETFRTVRESLKGQQGAKASPPGVKASPPGVKASPPGVKAMEERIERLEGLAGLAVEMMQSLLQSGLPK